MDAGRSADRVSASDRGRAAGRGRLPRRAYLSDQGAFVMAIRAATPETMPAPAMAATTSQRTSSIRRVYRARRALIPYPGSAIAWEE